MREYRLQSDSVQTTEKIGAALAHALTRSHVPSFVALYGDLGAGKTAFVRGFVSALSAGSRVKSPTYTIVNEYRRGEMPVFHFDLYRIEDPDELDSIGFDEYVQSGICIAEWSEHLGDRCPEEVITVSIHKNGEESRLITLSLSDSVPFAFGKEESESC